MLERKLCSQCVQRCLKLEEEIIHSTFSHCLIFLHFFLRGKDILLNLVLLKPVVLALPHSTIRTFFWFMNPNFFFVLNKLAFLLDQLYWTCSMVLLLKRGKFANMHQVLIGHYVQIFRPQIKNDNW